MFMLEALKSLDTQAFLLLNGIHHPVMDSFMSLMTNKFTWIPLYLFFIYFIFKQEGKSGWKILVAILMCILISDQVCSGLLKPWVARLRPCHEPSLGNVIHLVGGCGGQYGFCSSHAANSFTLAVFFYLIYGKSQNWVKFLLPWAIIVSYSRIYVGVHYPGDVICGALIGSIAAYGVVKVFQNIQSSK